MAKPRRGRNFTQIQRGKVIAETAPVKAQLKVLGNEAIDFLKR